MGLQNAQPRFGYDAEDNTIFDYLTSRSVKVGGVFESADGHWDSHALVHLIKTQQPVEGARRKAVESDKVEQANADFEREAGAAEAAERQRIEAAGAERQRLQDEDRAQEEEMARRDAEFVQRRQAEEAAANQQSTGTGDSGGQQQEPQAPPAE